MKHGNIYTEVFIMIIAFDGLDGAGKTTALNSIFRDLYYNHCVVGKKRCSGAIHGTNELKDDDIVPLFFNDEQHCCSEKCIIKLKHGMFPDSLKYFEYSIRELIKKPAETPWSEIAYDFLAHCKESNYKLFRGLFFFPYFRLTNISAKNRDSIVLIDRYWLSDIAYHYTNDIVKNMVNEAGSLLDLMETHVRSFDWDIYPFSEVEKEKYRKLHPIKVEEPQKIIYVGTSPKVCIEHLSERNSKTNEKTKIHYYETEKQLEDKDKNYRQIFNNISSDKILLVGTAAIRDKSNLSVISSTIRGNIEALLKSNDNYKECQIAIDRNNNNNNIEIVSDVKGYDLERYEICYQKKIYKVPSPTKLIGTLTDFSHVSKFYLQGAEEKAWMMTCGILKQDNIHIHDLARVHDTIKSIHETPNKMLENAAKIGTQTHLVVEKVIRHIIEDCGGEVSRYNHINIKNLKVDIFKKATKEVGKEWIQDQQWEMLSYFEEYQQKYIKRWIGSEILVFNKKSEVAGRFDAIGIDKDDKIVIVDFKTSKTIRQSHFMQIIIYNLLINGYFSDLEEIFNKNGVISNSDLAKQLFPLQKEQTCELLDINNYFTYRKRTSRNKNSFVDAGHIVHLDKVNRRFLCREVDFDTLKEEMNIDPLDANLLNNLFSAQRLYDYFTNSGKGKNKEGENFQYGTRLK